jgi:hypothetical protein
MAWPFLDPVDAADEPKYYKMIKEPMGMVDFNFRTVYFF